MPVCCPGLAPEYVEFRDGEGMVTKEKARHNLLRPEALEAMFVLWRTTKNPIYKDWAWQMFQAFQAHCRVRHHPVRGWAEYVKQCAQGL